MTVWTQGLCLGAPMVDPRDSLRAWLVPVLGIVAVGLAAVAMVGPWWAEQYQGSFFRYTENGWGAYGLFGWTSQDVVISWPASPNRTTAQAGDYSNLTQIGGVFAGGTDLGAVGTACSAAAAALVAVPKLRPSIRRFAPIACMAGFVLLLAAALYVMTQLPTAANEDLYPPAWFIFSPGPVVSGFWGSGVALWNHGGLDVTYGAGWGWYALVAAAALLAVDSILILHRHRTHPWATLRRDN